MRYSVISSAPFILGIVAPCPPLRDWRPVIWQARLLYQQRGRLCPLRTYLKTWKPFRHCGMLPLSGGTTKAGAEKQERARQCSPRQTEHGRGL